MIDTTTKRLTLAEHLTGLNVDLERSDFQWLSTKVAKEYREQYPDEELKKVYRKNQKGKQISVGYGYDEKVLDIIDELLQL